MKHLLVLLFSALALISCGTSKSSSGNQILPGIHEQRKVSPGDYLLERGTSLNLASARKCRFFVANGAALSIRSCSSCTIFAEPGAQVAVNSGTMVLPADSAAKQYGLRNTLKPAGEFSPDGVKMTERLNPLQWLGKSNSKGLRKNAAPDAINPASYSRGGR